MERSGERGKTLLTVQPELRTLRILQDLSLDDDVPPDLSVGTSRTLELDLGVTLDGSVLEEGLDEICSTKNFGRPAEPDGDSTDDRRFSSSVGSL